MKLTYAVLEFVFGIPPLVYLFHYDWKIGLCVMFMVFSVNMRIAYKLEKQKDDV